VDPLSILVAAGVAGGVSKMVSSHADRIVRAIEPSAPDRIHSTRIVLTDQVSVETQVSEENTAVAGTSPSKATARSRR